MSAVPARARTAAVLFLVHGSLVLLNTFLWQVDGGAVSAAGLFRVVVRVVGIALIATGLFRGARWAWMFGVVLAGLWLLLGVVGAVAVVAAGANVAVSLPGAAFLSAALATLGAAWTLLLTRDVRQAFRSR